MLFALQSPKDAKLTAAAATINPNGIKTILANGLSTFCIKGNPAFSNDNGNESSKLVY